MVIIVGCVWDLVVSSSSSTLKIMHTSHQEAIFLSIFLHEGFYNCEQNDN